MSPSEPDAGRRPVAGGRDTLLWRLVDDRRTPLVTISVVAAASSNCVLTAARTPATQPIRSRSPSGPVLPPERARREPDGRGPGCHADCVLGPDNPTCVSLSVSGDVPGSVVLSTCECANFLGTGWTASKKASTVATFVEAVVDSRHGERQVALRPTPRYNPLVDKVHPCSSATRVLCKASSAICTCASTCDRAPAGTCTYFLTSTPTCGDPAREAVLEGQGRFLSACCGIRR